MVMLAISAGWAILGPVHAYYYHGIKSSTIDVKIPFVEDSNTEFMINITAQFIIFFHGCMVYTGLEIAMDIFKDFAKISPKLIKLRLDELCKMIEIGELSEAKNYFTFKDIVKQTIDCDK